MTDKKKQEPFSDIKKAQYVAEFSEMLSDENCDAVICARSTEDGKISARVVGTKVDLAFIIADIIVRQNIPPNKLMAAMALLALGKEGEDE